MRKDIGKTVSYLKKRNRILFLATSNRWSGLKDEPKSTLLARHIAKEVGEGKVNVIDVTKLKIYPCEGNVSARTGNYCGTKDAVLKDAKKNPSGNHRCWASINNRDDELWKISRELLQSDAVVFFGSVRWGQMNSIYQTLIERLTWLDNRHTTLGEDNLLKDIDAGVICIGQNWNVDNVVRTQKDVLAFFGFRAPKELSWGWQYTADRFDESQESYGAAFARFLKDSGIRP
jgi:multimeric flavodoxin WrbA